MKKLLAFLALVVSSFAALKTNAADSPRYSNPVLRGDYPDPTIVRVGADYYATATSSEWGPQFPLLQSADLVNWRIIGTVFPTRPDWAEANFWAPEMCQWKGKFFLYYVGRKKAGSLAVAVATASRPEGPWTDHGPLVSQAAGSIDPMAVDDEKGERWLVWKEDGNSRKKPTVIWAQRLDENGTKLVGELHELIRNDAPWEGAVVEGPFVIQRGGWFYLFFAGNACCGRDCNYGEGVARSQTLLGPWEKCPRNPILTTNAEFRGPGHGSIVADPKGRLFLLYHSYNAHSFIFTGREMMLDEIVFGQDGWPVVNEGKGPSVSAPSPLGGPQRREELAFFDDFGEGKLRPGYQWPQDNPPQTRFDPGANGGELLLKPAPARSAEMLGAVLARSCTSADYAATTAVEMNKLGPGMRAGLSAFGDAANALVLIVGDQRAELWDLQRGQRKALAQMDKIDWPLIHMRMIASGRTFEFAVSPDGREWKSVGEKVDGDYLPPWDRNIRIALTAGGAANAEARFRFLRIESGTSEPK